MLGGEPISAGPIAAESRTLFAVTPILSAPLSLSIVSRVISFAIDSRAKSFAIDSRSKSYGTD